MNVEERMNFSQESIGIGTTTAAADTPLYGLNEHKIFPILKAVQFLLLTWLVSGSRFLQVYTVETMMYNTSIAMSMIFVLSGFLTHLHFSSLILNSKEAIQIIYEQYIWLRVLVHIPIYLFSLCWASISSILYGDFTLTKSLNSLFLTSSIATLYPLENSTKVSQLAFFTCPTFILASSLVICWLIYPVYAKTLHKLEAIHGMRLAISIFLILMLPLLLASTQVSKSIITGNLNPNEEGKILPYRETDTIWGAAVWYINPCFKLPLFLVGVEAGEVVRQFKWHVNSNADVDNSSDVNSSGSVYRYIRHFLYGVMIDICIIGFYCLLRYDPRIELKSDSLIFHRIGTYIWKILGYSYISNGYVEWLRTGSAIFMTLWSVILVLLTCPTTMNHSKINRILTLSPILNVLPGRSGLIMSFIYPLVYSSFSKDNQLGFESGRGLAFMIVMLFIISIPFYYYVYQPFQLWVIARTVTSIENRRKFMENPNHNNDADTDNINDIQGAVVEYLDHSPSYDSVYPGEVEKEKGTLQGIMKGSSVVVCSYSSWLYAVFVGFHIAYNRNK